MNILLNPLAENFVYPDKDFEKEMRRMIEDLYFIGETYFDVANSPTIWNVYTFDEVIGI